MARGRTRWLVVLVAALTLVLVAGLLLHGDDTPAAAAAPEVGHPAPGITLRDTVGRQVTLSDYRGKIVLVNFFATWCVPCGHELPRINRAYVSHRHGFVVLAIDRDEPLPDVRQFVSRLHLEFSPLLDPGLVVRTAYRVNPEPVSFWVDRNGVIRAIDYEMDDARIASELRHLRA